MFATGGTPEQQVAAIEQTVETGGIIGGVRRRGGSQAPSIPLGEQLAGARARAARAAAEEARQRELERIKAEERARIQREEQQRIFEERQKFQQASAREQTEEGKRERLTEFLSAVENIQQEGREERLRSGVITKVERRVPISVTEARREVLTPEGLRQAEANAGASITRAEEKGGVQGEEGAGIIQRQVQRLVESPLGQRIVPFEERKEKERQELLRKKQAGEKLSFIERQKLKPLEKRLAEEQAPPKPGGKIAAALDKSVADALAGISKAVALEERLPERFVESKVGKVVLKKRQPFLRASDVAKFVAFAPALATTTEAVSRAVSTGAIKPKTKTRFEALVKQRGDVASVEVISKTRVGGKTIRGVSRQFSKDVDDIASATLGKGVQVQRIKGQKVRATTFDILGEARRLGKARKPITTKGDVQILREIGGGVETKAVVRETAQVTERLGIGVVKRIKTKPLKVRDVRLTFRGVRVKPRLQEERLVGVLTKTQRKDVLGFIGQTGRATTRISKEGIAKRITDPNVVGIIKTVQKEPLEQTVSKIITTSPIKRTPLSKTFEVQKLVKPKPIPKPTTKQVQQALTQATGLTQQASKTIIKDLSAPSISPIAKIKTRALPIPTALRKQRFQDMTGISKFDAQLGRTISSLGVQEGRIITPLRLDLGISQVEKVRQKTQLKTISKTIQEQENDLRNLTRTRTKQTQKEQQRQKQRLRQQLRTQQKQQQKQQQRISSPLVFPKPPKIKGGIFFFGLPFIKQKPIKKKRKPTLKKREEAISEKFLVRSLQGLEASQKELLKRVKTIQ